MEVQGDGEGADARRTLMLAWHDVFPFPEPPSWWTDPIPTVVREADPNVEYEPRRSPSKYLSLDSDPGKWP